jgi:hypothetical protein
MEAAAAASPNMAVDAIKTPNPALNRSAQQLCCWVSLALRAPAAG